MNAGLAYWILMLLWLVGSAVVQFRSGVFVIDNVIAFLLFVLLGWHVFGAPIK